MNEALWRHTSHKNERVLGYIDSKKFIQLVARVYCMRYNTYGKPIVLREAISNRYPERGSQISGIDDAPFSFPQKTHLLLQQQISM